MTKLKKKKKVFPAFRQKLKPFLKESSIFDVHGSSPFPTKERSSNKYIFQFSISKRRMWILYILILMEFTKQYCHLHTS